MSGTLSDHARGGKARPALKKGRANNHTYAASTEKRFVPPSAPVPSMIQAHLTNRARPQQGIRTADRNANRQVHQPVQDAAPITSRGHYAQVGNVATNSTVRSSSVYQTASCGPSETSMFEAPELQSQSGLSQGRGSLAQNAVAQPCYPSPPLPNVNTRPSSQRECAAEKFGGSLPHMGSRLGHTAPVPHHHRPPSAFDDGNDHDPLKTHMLSQLKQTQAVREHVEEYHKEARHDFDEVKQTSKSIERTVGEVAAEQIEFSRFCTTMMESQARLSDGQSELREVFGECA